MKTNMGSLVDDVSKIKYSLSEIEKMLGHIDSRILELEISQPCDCLVDVDMNKINDLLWEVQKLVRKNK